MGTAVQSKKRVELCVENSVKSQRQGILNLPKKALVEGMSQCVYDYISQTVPLFSEKVLVVDSYKAKNYYDITSPLLGIVDVCPVNNALNINQFLFNLNNSIPEATIFVGCFVIEDSNEKSLSKQQSTKFELYKAEALGRLVYSGFSIIEFKEIEGLLFFMVMKIKNAPEELEGCSNRLIFSMNRIGEYGKNMEIFKFRTMHPYSKYLQDYVVRLNGYNESGKPADDFRLVAWGKIFRKYWLDEMPQLFNFFKGELAVVGVRPLSKTRFAELPKDVQEMRIKFKPGCIPPYVALNMPDSKGNIEAERIYMQDKLKNGVRTDIKYFFKAVYNILTGKITSS